MKKFIPILISIAGFLWGSCTNDAILIEAENYFDLTVQVNTDKLYEDFTIKNSIMQQVLSSSTDLRLGVITLAYDEEGNFTDSVCTYLKTFAQVRQAFELKEGNYTFVTYETIVDPNNDYKAQYWELKGTDKLSTVQLTTSEAQVYWTGVIGLHAQQIAVHQDKDVSMTPAPIGSLVNIHYFKLDQTDFDYVGFMTKNRPIGIMLDPTLSGNERYVYDSYTPANTWVARGLRSNRGGHLDETIQHTVYILEEGRIQWCFGPSTIGEDNSVRFTAYPNNNSYYDFVNAAYNYAGLYVVNNSVQTYLGSRDGYNQWHTNMENTPVVVETQVYRTPYLTWDGTVQAVKTYMSTYTISRDITFSEKSNAYYLQYEGKDKEDLYEYDFTTISAGLTDAYVRIPTGAKVTIEQINKQLLAEGYTYNGYDSEYESYDYSTGNTSVIVYLDDSNNWIINYYDPAAYSSPVKASKMPRRQVK